MVACPLQLFLEFQLAPKLHLFRVAFFSVFPDACKDTKRARSLLLRLSPFQRHKNLGLSQPAGLHRMKICFACLWKIQISRHFRCHLTFGHVHVEIAPSFLQNFLYQKIAKLPQFLSCTRILVMIKTLYIGLFHSN